MCLWARRVNVSRAAADSIQFLTNVIPTRSNSNRALKDLRDLLEPDRRRIVAKIEALQGGLVGSVRRLTNFTPEYRLRAGDYRVLFEIEGQSVVVYRVLHRKEAYR